MKTLYSPVRTTLFESLPYRIIIGLSRILVGSKEFSLQKTINVVSQMDEHKSKARVTDVICVINEFLGKSKLVASTTSLRDKLIAHLDKECVLSDGRIDVSVTMEYVDQSELQRLIALIKELYIACYTKELSYSTLNIDRGEVIDKFFDL